MARNEESRRLGLTRSDMEFGRRLDNRARFAEKIDWLVKEKFGISIVANYFEDEDDFEQGLKVPRTVGYLLPLKLNSSASLIMLKDGDMFATRPPRSKNETINNKFIADYVAAFSPDINPVIDFDVFNPGVDMIEDISKIRESLLRDVEEVSLGSPDAFAQVFDKGISIGRILKTRREKGRDLRIEKILGRMEVLFEQEGD